MLSTDDLDASIAFYMEAFDMALKFRDGSPFAALDGGGITLALATSIDHPRPGTVVPGIKTSDLAESVELLKRAGGTVTRGPSDHAHERRAVVSDNNGNPWVLYTS